MKGLFTAFALFLSITLVFGQGSVEGFVKKGIDYHDKGEYDKAITSYQRALKLEPKSPLVNYEISLSYFKKGNYAKAIEYSDVVLDQRGKYMLEAYLTKGSALDVQGKAKESIKLFKKGIRRTKGHYLLHYNLALTYFKLKEYKDAEESIVEAIDANPRHGSSHLLLANLHSMQDHSAQALIALHYFLFLEPSTARSKEAYKLMQRHFGGNVSKDPNDPNTISINLAVNSDTEFGALDLMISLLIATNNIEENAEKTDDQLFIDNTRSFFKMMGEMSTKKKKGIWWTFYAPFFYDIAESEHMPAYCYYISISGNENAQAWLEAHETEMQEFKDWLLVY